MKRLHEFRLQDQIAPFPARSATAAQSLSRTSAPHWFAIALLGLCAGACNSKSKTSTVPAFQASNFSNPTVINHPSLPLIPGTTHTYLSEDPDGAQVTIVEIKSQTRAVLGIECRVVRDRVFEEGVLIEDTVDWYAQDNQGNVWYMGEEVLNYHYDELGNLTGTDTAGSWEAGKDVANVGSLAQPGYQLPALLTVGQTYHQEFYPGQAEDMAQIVGVNVPLTLANGDTHACVKVREWNPLEPGSDEFKYMAAGVGFVRAEKVGAPEFEELQGSLITGAASLPSFSASNFTNPTQIDHALLPFNEGDTHLILARAESEDGAEVETIIVEVLPGARLVAGIDCVRVRDRVFLEDLLIEDTEDWYAQDDAGNVWYMGEEVINYEYDENGAVVSMDNEGSWEAGLDVSGVGSLASPGYVMPAQPAVGQSFHQEFYLGEAEDLFLILADEDEFELSTGQTYTGVLKTLDLNPLDPGQPEFKYYAPGVGFVGEVKLGAEERVENIGRLDVSAGTLPVFSATDFSTPTFIDNPYLPFPFSTTTNYVSQTDEGEETVVSIVTGTTRVVAGVDCSVVWVREYLDGVIQEDTEDWYAQDNAGNVWYMGEEVDNYNYDDLGNLEGITHEGSWEAGLDVASTGFNAEPGWLMQATPVVGQTYRQELYPTEAEDMAVVVRSGLTITLSDGTTTYSNCLRTLEWNPLHPQAVEYKLYAPGLGVIRTEDPISGVFVEIQP